MTVTAHSTAAPGELTKTVATCPTGPVKFAESAAAGIAPGAHAPAHVTETVADWMGSDGKTSPPAAAKSSSRGGRPAPPGARRVAIVAVGPLSGGGEVEGIHEAGVRVGAGSKQGGGGGARTGPQRPPPPPSLTYDGRVSQHGPRRREVQHGRPAPPARLVDGEGRAGSLVEDVVADCEAADSRGRRVSLRGGGGGGVPWVVERAREASLPTPAHLQHDLSPAQEEAAAAQGGMRGEGGRYKKRRGRGVPRAALELAERREEGPRLLLSPSSSPPPPPLLSRHDGLLRARPCEHEVRVVEVAALEAVLALAVQDAGAACQWEGNGR